MSKPTGDRSARMPQHPAPTRSRASLELFEPGFPDTSGTATGTWLLVPVN